MHLGSWFYIKELFVKLPKFKKTLWIFERFRLKNIDRLKTKYYKYLDEFYAKNNLPEKIQKGIIWKEIL